MDSALATDIVVLLVMLALSAFYSGSEMAFVSSNKLLIEIGRSKHPRLASIIDIFYAHSSLIITTILVGNNITMVIFGLVFSDTVTPLIGSYVGSASLVLLLETILSTVVIIITGEFLPKSLVQLNPSLVLYVVALPLYLFYLLFYPISAVMQKLATLFIRYVLRSPTSEQSATMLPGRVEFDELVSRQVASGDGGTDVGMEAKLMRNALDFSKIKVRDCYVPRTDVVAVSIDESVERLYKKFVDSGFSKILIYRGPFDNIVGYVHVSEMFKGGKSIREMMSPIAIVPETMRANLLLKQFTSQHKSIAIVVDEFGGMSGMITLEDVLEEIFGEINDEHDQDGQECRRVDDHTYVISGRVDVDDINKSFGLRLPLSDDYDTLGGLILSATHSIPRQGDIVRVGDYELKVAQAGRATVDKVVLSVP